MKIIFQQEDFNVEKNIKFFSESNKNAGSVFSFIGKVRPKNKNLKIKDIDIEFYEEMALYQMKKVGEFYDKVGDPKLFDWTLVPTLR